MALPSTFSGPYAYFEKCVNFLQTYSWIYQYANTNFLKDGVLEKMAPDEKLYFKLIKTEALNEFPLVNNTIKDNMPISLKEFRKDLIELIPTAAFAEPSEIKFEITPTLKKMNLKKQHEICRLAYTINELCETNEVLIDFGAGHGYLSEMLIKINSTFRILGLEAEQKRVEAARLRQTENIPETKNAVVYKQQFITEASQNFIEQCVQEEFQSMHSSNLLSWSIIGLHACADLTVTSMRLFFHLPKVRRLIIMPCCYHKLKMTSSGEFTNFPLSESLRNAMTSSTYDINKIFNRPFLRLACQQTLARWCCSNETDHSSHGLEMWQRAVAEAVLDEQEIVIRQKNNKDANLDLLEESLTFKRLTKTYKLHSKLDNSELNWQWEHQLKFNDITKKYPQGAKLAEGLTCLQTTMQKLCENIVLYDRLCYMQECAANKGVKITARFEKLMNEKLSPRCYVLIAEKLNET